MWPLQICSHPNMLHCPAHAASALTESGQNRSGHFPAGKIQLQVLEESRSGHSNLKSASPTLQLKLGSLQCNVVWQGLFGQVANVSTARLLKV